MKYTEVKDNVIYKLEELVTQASDPNAPPIVMDLNSPPRSPGLHLSQIIQTLYQFLNPKAKERGEFEGRSNMALGFGWEQLLSYAVCLALKPVDAEQMIHPGEVSSDGIAMSPDAIWVCSPDEFEEWKCTMKSAAKTPEDYTTWIWQIKSYARALGLTKARLRILHLMGAYGKGEGECQKGMCVKTWMLSFTKRELDENWEMILNCAREKGWV